MSNTRRLSKSLSRVDGSVGISVAAHNSLCSNHIYEFGTEEQKQKYLVPLARGEHLGAWGLTEPSAGSDASGTRSTAVRQDGGWLVNGSKNFITHAIHADTCVAVAVTDRAKSSKGSRPLSSKRECKGSRPQRKKTSWACGLRKPRASSLKIVMCRTKIVWERKAKGFVNAMQILDGGRISIAALAVGIAQGAYESALRYSKERQQFGKPISEFQAIQFKLADMATQIDAARLLMYRAAWLKDQERKVTKESSMAKLFASEMSVKVCEEAIQIHGGYGYTKDYPAEKYWRDSKLCTIGEGTSEIQRMIIAREILKQAG